MDITFGLDISHHQDKSLDLAQCRRDGCQFVFLKGTEGSGYTDPDFVGNLAEARNAGLLVAAYVFVRSNATPAAHVTLARKVIPLDVPVVLDVETAADGSKPTLAHTRAVLSAFQSAGWRTPLIYIPRWYWGGLVRDGFWGSPSLAGLPPLWSSRYPDNVVGVLGSEWAQVPASYWAGYGGLDVAVLQFTSSARIAGYSPLDANAYRGTREQLAALLTEQEDDLTTEEHDTLMQILNQLMGPWKSWVPGASDDAKFTLVNYARAIDKNVFAQGTQISALLAAVAASTNDPAITVDTLRQIVNDAVAQHIQITGEVHIGAAPATPTA